MINDKFLVNKHKLNWHLDRVNDWNKGKKIAPLYIDMGITQTCNIKCQYCYYATPENRTTKIITLENFKKFAVDCAEIGVKGLGILGDGEPMVHPDCYDMTIAGAEAGIDMCLSTNGTVMPKEKFVDFLGSLSFIRFNISAATPETYSKIMGTSPKMFDLVKKNITRCVEAKQKHNLKTTIGMQMVLVEECVKDIVPYTKLAKELGVDYIMIKQCSEHGVLPHGIVPKDYNLYEDLYKESEGYIGDDFSVFIKRVKMNNTNRKYHKCFGTNFLPQIDGAGDVYPCGNWFQSKEFNMGNINDQSFKDIVFSDKYAEVQKKVSQEVNVHKQCGSGCRQNEINEYLWELKNPPQHLNFI
jgi:radical SAM protein with 4Fe4S-binding SPASM domain